MASPTRNDCLALDSRDQLADFRNQFQLADDLIYLDGNSLGVLPRATKARLLDAVEIEWGQDLIKSWNKHGWMHLPTRVGDKIAGLIGAKAGQVVAADSTSINVYKVVSSALKMQKGRIKIISDQGNFPTDLYMVQGITNQIGRDKCQLNLVSPDDVISAIDDDTALVMLTQVDFRTGRIYDMDAITKAAHAKGALVCWDLCHSAGAIPVLLDECNVDFAVGCGYKYLNGGPGAPAFVYVAKRHLAKAFQPLSGWHGHASPFDFSTEFTPANTIESFLCGTPSVLAMIALEVSLDIWAEADMTAVRKKSMALCDLFIELVEDRCANHGFELISPRDANLRGSQVSFSHSDGFPITQALIAANVVGDFRAPNVLRFGFTPLYTSYVDVWDAVDRLVNIMATKSYDAPEFNVRGAVT